MLCYVLMAHALSNFFNPFLLSLSLSHRRPWFSSSYEDMSTLLDSRAHHHRVHVLSRKACKSEIFNEEPRNRRRLFNPESVLDNSAERLRTCQDDTENVCFSNVFAHSPVTENVLRQTSSRSRQQAGQLRRQDNVRKKKAGMCRIRELQSRPVGSRSVDLFSLYWLHCQIMPCVRHTSRDRREQSADFPQSHNVQRSQEVDHIIKRTSTWHQRQRGQQRLDGWKSFKLIFAKPGIHSLLPTRTRWYFTLVRPSRYVV